MLSKPNMPSGAVPMSLEVTEHFLRQAIDSRNLPDDEREDLHYALRVVIAEAKRGGRI